MSKGVGVSIVLVLYKNLRELKKCLESIKGSNYKNYEIIIVDNLGHKNLSFIKGFKKIKIISMNYNSGYSEGNNVGIRNSKGKYVLVMNPDIAINKNSLFYLVKFMEKNKDVVLCQPKILLSTNKSKINTDGNKAHFLGFGYCGNYNKNDSVNNLGFIETPYVSGACFIGQRDKLIKIGLFDQIFFMYHEDFDLGIRARMLGYKVGCYKNSVVYHSYKFKKNNTKNYNVEKNRIISLLKTYESKTILLLLPVLILTELGIIFVSIKEKWFGQKLRGYLFIGKHLKKIILDKKIIQKSRIIHDHDLFNFFVDAIDFEPVNNYAKYLNIITKTYFKFVKWIIKY